MNRSSIALSVCVVFVAGLGLAPARAVAGAVSGTSSYTQNCQWRCHLGIAKARVKACQNKAGQRRVVYWERMSVVCNPTEGH
jgi:hypothetical protein